MSLSSSDRFFCESLFKRMEKIIWSCLPGEILPSLEIAHTRYADSVVVVAFREANTIKIWKQQKKVFWKGRSK